MPDPQDPALWDGQAAEFDASGVDHGLLDPAARVAWRGLLLALLPGAPARVADLGCGTGTLSVLLADEGYAVDGVDFAPEMVREAEAKRAGRSGVTFTLGDAADPPLLPGTYDVVLSRHVLWALPDHEAALSRWLELLRPDGRLVLIEGRWSSGHGLSSAETLDLLRSAGRDPRLTPLPDPVYWGRETGDERYAVVA